MTLAELLDSLDSRPQWCVPCADRDMPATAIPGTNICIACYGHELVRQAVGR